MTVSPLLPDSAAQLGRRARLCRVLQLLGLGIALRFEPIVRRLPGAVQQGGTLDSHGHGTHLLVGGSALTEGISHGERKLTAGGGPLRVDVFEPRQIHLQGTIALHISRCWHLAAAAPTEATVRMTGRTT